MNTPDFIWKGKDALIDMGCIIENELPEILPNQHYETKKILGRHGEIHETHGDYQSYDYPIKGITIPYDRLREVKVWLRGHDKLITHNDIDKYRDAICAIDKETSFESEWGVFYKFDVTFRCQPFMRKIREVPINFDGPIEFFDFGDEVASPYLEIASDGGDIILQIQNRKIILLNTSNGLIKINTEYGIAIQNDVPLFTKGDWIRIHPGRNLLLTGGNIISGKLWNRSVWL
ncbi:phage tail protein [Melissococcus plutonius]|uniref:phage tail protein n=1 Tax=Melissococcus plutonius TaxID=33970 RepID=UPI0021E6099D|nr:phage tail protein [Melissococcus plutonius]MCV2499593.1 phage tail protein [Melissococcus plutonius]MCV2501513.1 phage tail protein [Melissococcus plutonius]MCV2505986.1 phage tail protein [Melissococcus plutonius]MCV2508227.1 phage tail protein [Melissococcus plutonius]MCV2519985.1 phage tail protein [Melissococcus plutonius]